MMKLTTLTSGQRAGWYLASAAYGLFLVIFASRANLFSDAETAWFPAFVFCVAWFVGVAGLRFYVQDKNPTNFKSILGLGEDTDRKDN